MECLLKVEFIHFKGLFIFENPHYTPPVYTTVYHPAKFLLPSNEVTRRSCFQSCISVVLSVHTGGSLKGPTTLVQGIAPCRPSSQGPRSLLYTTLVTAFPDMFKLDQVEPHRIGPAFCSQPSFSQTHKINNIGIIANFVLPYSCHFLLYLYHMKFVNVKLDISGCKSRLKSLFV